MIESYSCETILNERKKIFSDLYRTAFPKVARFISQRNGSLENAQDIFQDALVIYHEKIMESGIQPFESDEAYVIGISKHLWIRKFNNERNVVSLSDYEEQLQIPEDFYPTVETNRLLKFLEAIGKRCMDLLEAFYFSREGTRLVASKFGFSSEHSATVQKYKCLEKVRAKVKEKTLHYEDFFE